MDGIQETSIERNLIRLKNNQTCSTYLQVKIFLIKIDVKTLIERELNSYIN